MEALRETALVLATLSKHQIAGIVGFVVGGILLLIGAVRGAARMPDAVAVLAAGVIIIILGILVFTRVF